MARIRATDRPRSTVARRLATTPGSRVEGNYGPRPKVLRRLPSQRQPL